MLRSRCAPSIKIPTAKAANITAEISETARMVRGPVKRLVAPTTPEITAECSTAAVANPEMNGMNPAMLVACEATTLPPTVAVHKINVGELRATPRPSPTARNPLARRSGDESSMEPPRAASRSAAAANQQRMALPPSQSTQAAGGH